MYVPSFEIFFNNISENIEKHCLTPYLVNILAITNL
jgi:hypothetical protein